jgi:hypothetical protein
MRNKIFNLIPEANICDRYQKPVWLVVLFINFA